MIPYSEENDGFKYLLTVIDCFSKYAWVVPLKNKNGFTTSQALQTIFKQRKPQKMQTDKGKEYYNKEINKLFKANSIIHFSTESDKKASIIERFNRTLKEKMWKIFTFNDNHKWIESLGDLVNNYNNSYHRSIKMSPIKASDPKNKTIVHKNLFGNTQLLEVPNKKTKFNIGDTVRVTKYKTIFAKGYLPNWSTEQFKIDKVHNTSPITYEIKDLADEKIKGKFYEEELTLHKNIENKYHIEKILKRRTRNGKREVLVKWYGYPEKFNSWIPESNLSDP
ncbi:Protein CBG24082 [Caenorhabditis briggsae]|uniref:Protein CBG24082 n=1 Tax=Caenorhabditis briggsae TaxID=6238 RepID=A8WJY1_CAEBR|nr:Protein CBG24082 [Caenorhabditis briggsae]CAP20774.2 Protein CBG24082 [Caenorhabditis briggsae]